MHLTIEQIPSKPPLSLYQIQNDIYHYQTGRLSNGNQLLIQSDLDGPPLPLAHWIEFDTEGNLLAAYDQSTPQPLPGSSSFTLGTIKVKPFFIPEILIGIQDLPDHYQEFLDHPENANEDERFYYPEEIQAWREAGNFVLWFNEDYYLNEEGELESS